MSDSSPASSRWYWSKRGSDERNGPISGEKLRELAEEGDLEPEDLVWTEGMDDWEEASSVEGVKDFFVSPPPLPEEPAEQGGTQQETPPPLSQGEKSEPEEEDGSVESRANESEALSCIHDYDENDVCRKCGWSRTELKSLDKEKKRENTLEFDTKKVQKNKDNLQKGDKKGSNEEKISHWIHNPDWIIITVTSLNILAYLLMGYRGLTLVLISVLICWFGYSLYSPTKAIIWHKNPSRGLITMYFFGALMFIGQITPPIVGGSSSESRVVELCEEKVREEHDVVRLFGSMDQNVAATVADESSEYPGGVLNYGDGEYEVTGFVAMDHITQEETGVAGDAYVGTSFTCKVDSTKKGFEVVRFDS
jgi:hypothetical protein